MVAAAAVVAARTVVAAFGASLAFGWFAGGAVAAAGTANDLFGSALHCVHSLCAP